MQKEQQADKTSLPKTIYSSEKIFQGKKEMLIEHRGELYQLRITRNGKLILTK